MLSVSFLREANKNNSSFNTQIITGMKNIFNL